MVIPSVSQNGHDFVTAEPYPGHVSVSDTDV
jgi:hypothetical protein